MSIEVYLIFNGNCREAVQFYSEVFNTKLEQMMTYADIPNPEYQVAEEAKNLVLHTFLMINGNRVMFCDVLPDQPFTVGNNVSIMISSKNMDEIKTYFNKLKVGGKVEMDIQETFWSKCYGMVTDRFGVNWQLMLESE